MKWLQMFLIALLPCWLATPGAADLTQQDFSAVFQGTGDAPYVLVKSTVAGDNPIEITDRGVWDGNALWLTQNIGSQNNAVAFNELVSGPYDELVIGMDMQFSLYDPPGDGGADGFGLAYANSATWGGDNSWPIPSFTPSYAEEPNLAGSLGVGFDIYPNGWDDGAQNSVSLHWDAPWWRRGIWTSGIGAISICWRPERRYAQKSRFDLRTPDPTLPSLSWISTADTSRHRSRTTSLTV